MGKGQSNSDPDRMFEWIWDHLDYDDDYTSYASVTEDLETLRKSETARVGRDAIGKFFNARTRFKQEVLQHYDAPIKENNEKYLASIQTKINNSKTEQQIEEVKNEVESDKNNYESETISTLNTEIREKINELKTNIKELSKEVEQRQEEEKQKKEYEKIKTQIDRTTTEYDFKKLDAARAQIKDVQLRRELGREILKKQNDLNISAEETFREDAIKAIGDITNLSEVSSIASRISREAPTTRVESEALALLKEKRDELRNREESV